MKVAFLGLGRMGAPMAAHVARAGHDLTVWNRTPGKAADLVELGATEARSVAATVSGAEVVVLVLFGPAAVRAVLSDVVGHAPGALVVDASTIGPDAAHEFAKACHAGGLRYVDAPVAGSVQPATDGTLGVFLGGAAEDVAQARALVDLWGDPDRIRHVGGVGSASALKLCVNQSLGVIAAGLGESLRLGHDLGLDRSTVLDVLSSTGYGPYLTSKRSMLEADDYSGTTFSLDLLAKDLDLAVTSADSDLEVTRACLDQAKRALAAGHSGADYVALTGHLADEGEGNSH
jgi:3-hydroxyisobutyrate dehydrogenase-like beta-hydroxyacid dehydrogenase